MATKPRNARRTRIKAFSAGAVDARAFLEKLDGPLTFARLVRSIRLTDGYTLQAFAEKLGVSRQFICDVEHERRSVSPAVAARWGKLLGYPASQWVQYAVQADLDAAGLKFRVKVEAA